jgi:hypothetical protein
VAGCALTTWVVSPGLLIIRVSNGILDIVMVYETLALCDSCTGTWFI